MSDPVQIDDEISFHPRHSESITLMNLDSQATELNRNLSQNKDNPFVESNMQETLQDFMLNMTDALSSVVQEIKDLKASKSIMIDRPLVANRPNSFRNESPHRRVDLLSRKTPQNIREKYAILATEKGYNKQYRDYHQRTRYETRGHGERPLNYQNNAEDFQPNEQFYEHHSVHVDQCNRRMQGSNDAYQHEHQGVRPLNSRYNSELRESHTLPDIQHLSYTLPSRPQESSSLHDQHESQGHYDNQQYRRDYQGWREYSQDYKATDRHRGNQGYHRFRDNRVGDFRCQRPKEYSVKIPPFTGKEDWATWIARFEAIATRYAWSEDDKLDQLLPRLESSAADFVFTQLSPRAIEDYRELVAEMNSRFRVVETTRSFAAKFSRRNQGPGETAEQYAAELKRLYDKAHGYRDRSTRDEDLVRRFLDGLRDDQVRLDVEYHKEPRNIDEAVFHSVNLLQLRNVCRREKRDNHHVQQVQETESAQYGEDLEVERLTKISQYNRSQRPSQQKKTEDAILIQELMLRIEKLEGQEARPYKRQFDKRNIQCFNCQQMGHYARECTGRNEVPYRPCPEIKPTDDGQPLNVNGPALAAKGWSQ